MDHCKNVSFGWLRPADVMRQAALVVTEPGWDVHLFAMMRQAESNAGCRRSVIARSGAVFWGLPVLTAAPRPDAKRANERSALASDRSRRLRRHFAEAPPPCRGACDLCDRPQKAVRVDVTAEAKAVVDTLQSVPSAEKRLTLIQLIHRWRTSKVTSPWLFWKDCILAACFLPDS